MFFKRRSFMENNQLLINSVTSLYDANLLYDKFLQPLRK